MARILNIKRNADGVRIMIDDLTRGIDYPVPIFPTPEIRYDTDLNFFEFELKGVDHKFSPANDTIVFNDAPFAGTASEAAAKLRELFFLAEGGGGLSEEDVETLVDLKIAELVDSSPTTLNTLNELAAALNDDPNFATTITTSIGNKADKTDPVVTGDLVQKGASDFATLRTVHTLSNGTTVKGGIITDLNTGNVDVGALGSGGYRTRLMANGVVAAEIGALDRLFTFINDNAQWFKPESAASVNTGIRWKDFSDTALGRLVQNMGTGDMLLETHSGAGTPEIKLDYTRKEAIINGIYPLYRKWLTVDRSVADSTINTLANVTDMFFPVKAGERYWFKFTFVFNATASNNGSRWTINATTPANLTYLNALAEWSNSSTTTLKNFKSAFEGGTATSGSLSNNNRGWIEGEIEMSADDNIQLRFANNLANNAITALANRCYVEWRRIN